MSRMVSTSADPTMQLVDSLKRSSPKEWGKIIDGMPIFIAHKWYERTLKDGQKEARTILPGEAEPDPANGWKFVYEVTEDDLEETCEAVNKLFDNHAKPMKLLLGHTKPGQPQEAQPDLVGYGTNARMGSYGPKKIKAVVAKSFFRKGYEHVPAEYPERSPEFKPSTKTITGIAMLKTDPRLPMGMLPYAETDDTVFYGVGFMADNDQKHDDKPAAPAAVPPHVPPAHPAPAAAAPATPPAAPAAPTAPAAPASPAAPAAPQPAPLSPEECQYADRLMAHLQQNNPAMKYLCEQYQKYASAAAAAAPAATNGTTPATPIGGEKKPDDPNQPPKPEPEAQMQDEEEKRLYEERIAALELDRAKMYADQQITLFKSKHRIKLKDPAKLTERLIKARLKDDAACKEVVDDVLNNYARDERAPISRDFTPGVQADQQDAPEEKIEWTPEVNAEVQRYAENNKIDASTDDGWEKAVEGFVAAKKKKAQKVA
jgi:hypothetical protein